MLHKSTIINWLNRSILLIFVLLIIIGFTGNGDMFYYAALFTIIIGVFQLISSIIFHYTIRDKNLRKIGKVYLVSVFVFFLFGYLGRKILFFDNNSFFIALAYIPLFLCILFTYLSEANYKLLHYGK